MKRFLIPLAIFVLLLGFLGLGLQLKPREVPSPLIDKPAPNFTLGVLGNQTSSFTPIQMRGQVWLLNVWASWCVACREEHDLLMALNEQKLVPMIGLDYKDKVEGINLTFDNKKETILKNDRDIIDFYQRINNVNSLKEVTNEQLISLKEKLDKYTEIFQEFKNKTENILNYMNDQYDKLKQLEISHDNMTITSNNPKKTQDNLSGIFESPIKTYLTKYQSGQNPAAFKQSKNSKIAITNNNLDFNSEQLSKRKKLNNSPNKLSSSIKSLGT